MHFFGQHILSVVLFTPLVGALLLLFIPREMEQAHKIAGNIFGALGFLVSLPLVRLWTRNEEAECAKNVTRDLVRLLHLAGDEQQEQGAHEWREQNHAQDVLSKKVHALCLSAHAAQQYLHMVPVIR